MHFSFTTSGVCSNKISFELIGDTLHNVSFTGGCDGNLKAISKAVEGMSVEKVDELFSGITCGRKNTSCSDQLAKAAMAAAKQSKTLSCP